MDPFHSARPRLRPWMIAIALIVIASAILFSKTKDYGLMGWDAYPVIVSSRVQSMNDLTSNFTERLMDGWHPEDFYRPVLNLSIASDYALWGLAPVGYQMTSVLIFAGCATALYILVCRVAGPHSPVAPLVALGFFLLHATHIEVLPVPSRRPEMLCCLFMLISLALQLSRRSLTASRPPIAPAFFALLAFGSKETAFILPVLTFGAVLLYSPRPTLRRRLVHSGQALLPHAVALGVALVARISILGGIGGGRSAGFTKVFALLPRAIGRMSEYLVFPQPAMRESGIGSWMSVIGVISLVTIAVLMLHSYRTRGSSIDSETRLQRLIPISIAWLVLIGLSYAGAGRIRPWYMLLPVAGFGMMLGALAGWLIGLRHTHRGLARVAAVPVLAVVIAFVIWQGSYSPLVRDYDEWRRASAVSHAFLDHLATQVSKSPDGSVIEAKPIPIWAEPSEGGLEVRGAAILADYSIEAWSVLTLPGRRIRVCQSTDEACGQAGSDEVVVVLTERLRGY
jgi:hypothetical protein